MHKRKMACHAISQLLYLQIIMPVVDSEYAKYILSLHTAGLCYKQPLNNCIYIPCEYSFETNPFCHAYMKFNLAEFNLLQNLHLCTQKSVCSTNYGPLGEIGANFSLQLSSRTQFAKIDNKKVIAENQCEKHKKSSLDINCLKYMFMFCFCFCTHVKCTPYENKRMQNCTDN